MTKSIVNDLATSSVQTNLDQARSPRALIMINGIRCWYIDIEVTTNQFYVCDTFYLKIPLNMDPNPNLDYWSKASSLEVKIYIGFPSNPSSYSTDDLDLMIVGYCTDFNIDPVSGIITIHGRDLLSLFMDKKLTKNFANMSHSQAVAQLVSSNQLNSRIVPTDINNKVGNFFFNQNMALLNNTTQWDLIMSLAQLDQYVAFMDGETFVYEPRPSDKNVNNPFVLNYQTVDANQPIPVFNGSHISLSHVMGLAGDVTVVVKSGYNAKSGQHTYARVTSTHNINIKGVPKGSIKQYVYNIPGLSPDQAAQKAAQFLDDHTSHEMRLYVTMPGDNTLKKDSLIQLKGTQSGFDQIYYPEQVIRRMSPSEGYSMEITAKNRSQYVNT